MHEHTKFRSCMLSETQIGKKLEKSFAIDEEEDEAGIAGDNEDMSSSSDDESQTKKPPATPPTQWEEMQDFYFKKRFSRAANASEDSLMEDEELCSINLQNLYSESESKLPMNENENDNEITSPPSTSTSPPPPPPSPPRPTLGSEKLSSDTLDVIDDLLKSIEKEVASVEMNVEIPIVNAVEEVE
jgi:hypothetical protein